MSHHDDQAVDVVQRRLVDVQQDLTQVEFLRHYVYSARDGRIVRTYDTDFNGAHYVRTGIQTREAFYDVYTGVMCVTDPEFPDEPPRRVRQFLSDSGIISYTTLEGFAYQIPDNGAYVTECGA